MAGGQKASHFCNRQDSACFLIRGSEKIDGEGSAGQGAKRDARYPESVDCCSLRSHTSNSPPPNGLCQISPLADSAFRKD